MNGRVPRGTDIELTTTAGSRPILIALRNPKRSGELVLALETCGIPCIATFDARFLAYWQHTITLTAMVLDLDLPWALEVGEQLCRDSQRVVGICDDEVRQMRGLRAGFLAAFPHTDPPDALALRLRALIREKACMPLPFRPRTPAGPLLVDAHGRQAFWGPRELILTAREFSLLKYLSDFPGVVIPKRQLCQEFGWAQDNALSQAIWQVRRALGPEAARHIVNRRGYGYGYLPRLTQSPPIAREVRASASLALSSAAE